MTVPQGDGEAGIGGLGGEEGMMSFSLSVCGLCGDTIHETVRYSGLLDDPVHAKCHSEAIGCLRVCPSGCHPTIMMQSGQLLKCIRCGVKVQARQYMINYWRAKYAN